jgi:catalase (peroxidase I)
MDEEGLTTQKNLESIDYAALKQDVLNMCTSQIGGQQILEHRLFIRLAWHGAVPPNCRW